MNKSALDLVTKLHVTPDESPEEFSHQDHVRESLSRALNLAEGDLFELGGPNWDQMVARVLARL
jgi:hypothetical protein